jgi:hypothetical protein
MVKRKQWKRTMIYKTLRRRLKTEQPDPIKIGKNPYAPEV